MNSWGLLNASKFHVSNVCSKEKLTKQREWKYPDTVEKTLPGFSGKLGKVRLQVNSCMLGTAQKGGIRKMIAVF